MAKDKIFKEDGFDASPFGPPEGKGVYAICVMRKSLYPHQLKSCRVVYIGSSYKIKSRIKHQSHIYRRLYSILKNYIIMCFWMECDEHICKESELIKKYKPRFNIQLKN